MAIFVSFDGSGLLLCLAARRKYRICKLSDRMLAGINILHGSTEGINLVMGIVSWGSYGVT